MRKYIVSIGSLRTALAALLLAPLSVPADLVINELTTATVPGFFDDDGESSPWVELLNSGSNPLNLADFALSLEGRSASWTLPEETLAPGDRKLIFLSGKDRVPVESDTSFDPASVPGLAFWVAADGIDPTNPNQMQMVGGVPRISQWPDQSGRNHHLQAAGENRRPEWVENGLNGQPLLRFHRSSALFVPAPEETNGHSFDFSGGKSLFIVTTPVDISAGSQTVVGDYGHSFQWHQSGPQNKYYYRIHLTTGQNNSREGIPAGDIIDGNPIIASGIYNNQTIRNFRYGVPTETANLTGGPMVTPRRLWVGARDADRWWYDGDIAEVLIFERGVTDAERGQLEAYLLSKYFPRVHYHTDFRLQSGDTLEIRRSADATDIVDSVTITPLANGLALARFPEGSGPFLQALATPGDALPADADQRLVINEFLLENGGVVPDLDGDEPSLVELFNAGFVEIDTANFALTNGEGTPWALPAGKLAPGEFFTVYLSGKDRREITPLAPDAFDDLLLWLDASTIDTDPTAGQVRADGSDLLVQQWLDLSGSGHDAIQPTASLQPFFVADGLNGRPTLEFREQRAIYVPQTSTLSPSDAFTVIAVNILTNIAEDSQTIVGDYGHSFQLHKSGPQNKIYFRVIGENSAGMEIQNGREGIPGEFLSNGVANIAGGTFGSFELAGYLNGMQMETAALPIHKINTFRDVFIGARSNTQWYLGGSISEVLIYERALSPAEMLQVSLYLADKYNIPTAAGDFHTDFVPQQGQTLRIVNTDGTTLDSFEIGAGFPGASLARIPDGTGDFILSQPSFGMSNLGTELSRIEPSQILLSWIEDPTTTMTVTWRTDIPLPTQRVYYTDDLNETDLANFAVVDADSWTFDESPGWVHSAEITGLTPYTLYRTVVESEGRFSEPFLFRTLDDQPREIRIATGGDSRNNRTARRAVNTIAARDNVEFVIFSGDMIDNPISNQEWDDWFDDWHELMITTDNRRIPVIAAIGNHEVQGGYNQSPERAPFYYNRFRTPYGSSQYVLDLGPYLSLVTLDSQHTMPVAGAQTEWLGERLSELRERDRRWIMAQYHVPGWPSHRSFTGSVSVAIRNNWVPLFEQYGADLIIESHDHAYKRTVMIRGEEEDPVHGVLYTGDGGWGAPLRAVRNPDDFWWLAESVSAFHYTKVTVSADGFALTMEPIFTDESLSFPPFTIHKRGLTANAGPGGSINRDTYTVHRMGAQVALTAEPEEGFVFTGWTGDVVSDEPTITVTMEDHLEVTATFADPYELWRETYFTATELDNPAISGLGRDVSGDRITNLGHFSQWTNPKTSQIHNLPAEGTVELAVNGDEELYLTLTFQRVVGVDGLTYRIFGGEDPSALTEMIDLSTHTVSVEPNGDGLTETVTVRDSAPIGSRETCFLALEVSFQDETYRFRAVGFTNHFLAGVEGGTAGTVLSFALQPAPVYANTVFDVADDTIWVNGADFEGMPYAEHGHPHYVVFTTGDYAGRALLINELRGDHVIVSSETFLGTSVNVGDHFEIQPAWTLDSLFGKDEPLLNPGDFAGADHVLLWSGRAWVDFYHDGSQWRRRTAPVNRGAEMIGAEDGVFVRNNSGADMGFFLLGKAPAGSLVSMTAPASTQLKAWRLPANGRLGDIGLESVTGWRSGPTMAEADVVMLWNGAVYERYWHNGTEWRRFGNAEGQNNRIIRHDDAFFLIRAGDPGPEQDWVRVFSSGE